MMVGGYLAIGETKAGWLRWRSLGKDREQNTPRAGRGQVGIVSRMYARTRIGTQEAERMQVLQAVVVDLAELYPSPSMISTIHTTRLPFHLPLSSPYPRFRTKSYCYLWGPVPL